MNEDKLRQLEERIFSLEQKQNRVYRSRLGLSVDPTLNVLGQNTKINGNLDIIGDIYQNGELFSGGNEYNIHLNEIPADTTVTIDADTSAVLAGSILISGTLVLDGSMVVL